ncbi:hypothetical protein V2J09_010492 [Rumex salicifolius]
MGFSRKGLLVILVISAIAASSPAAKGGTFAIALARPIPSPSYFGKYSNVLETLGVACKCCDGGECKSSWSGSCSQLQCLPWKFH